MTEAKEKKNSYICIAMHYGAQNVKHVSEFTHVPNKCTLYVIAMYQQYKFYFYLGTATLCVCVATLYIIRYAHNNLCSIFNTVIF